MSIGVALFGLAQGILRGQPSDVLKPAVSPVVSAGNGIYSVHVQPNPGSGVGLYSATTGSEHPVGGGREVLYGGGLAGTSFTTIRSYTTGTDYVQRAIPLPSSRNRVISLDPFGTVVHLGTTGLRTTYELPGAGETADALTIHSDVRVNGSSAPDSNVEVATTVVNRGVFAVQVGIRYLWDFRIGNDDGPCFIRATPGAFREITELEIASLNFSSFTLQDNDIINFAPPTYDIVGSLAGPGGSTPPTPPNLLQFACWVSAFESAFDYQVDPLRDVARLLFFSSNCRGTAGGDSAVLYYFGASRESAITLQPGSQATISAWLQVAPPRVLSARSLD